TRHDHGDREQSPGTRRTVPQADTCTATRHDLVRATSPTPGPHRPPSSARSPPVRPRRPLIQPAMRPVYSPHYLSVDLLVMERCPLSTAIRFCPSITICLGWAKTDSHLLRRGETHYQLTKKR